MPAGLETLTGVAFAVILVVYAIRIGWSDLTERRIRNGDVLAFLVVALAYAVLRAAATDWTMLAADIGVGLLVFVTGLVFWSAGKLGAGDVKYLAAAPVAAGIVDLFVLLAALLGLSVVSLYLARYPMFVPERYHRLFFERTGGTSLIPYGVLISLAVSIVMALHLARMLFGL